MSEDGSPPHRAGSDLRLYDDLVWLWPLVSGPDAYGEEVETFRRRWQRHGVEDGARVLHLGSGGGSIDWHLKRHYDVTGVDISAAMVAHARGLNSEVRYVEGDIRCWRTDERFDAVLVHDAISYMTTVQELTAVYRTAAAHLNVGGVMVALPEELRARVVDGAASAETVVDGPRTVTIVQITHDPDPADHVCETTYVFVVRETGAVRVEIDRHRTGVFELDDFMAAMQAAGFEATAEPWELSDWARGEVPLPLITAVRVR